MMIEITEAQRQEVEVLLHRRDLAPRQRERLEMVKAAGLGQDEATIARWSGRTPRTVRRWLTRFVVGGAAVLVDAPRSGRPVEADVGYLRALDVAVTTPPPTLGLPFDVWTSPRLSAYLARERGVRIAPSWLRTLLTGRDYTDGRPTHTLTHLQDPAATAACAQTLAAVEKKVAQEPERYEMHYQDETHVETNPSLYKVWHRRGVQPPIPAAETNRRLTVFGSVEARGRGRVEIICPAQDSACFARYLAALDARHVATGKEVYLVLDNGPCHTSKTTKAALAARSAWLHVLWLAPYSPQLNPKEREWTRLKRDARSHLAPTLRAFVDEIAAGLRHLGGPRLDVVDQVPDWFIAGHRKEPTGRLAGRPTGATDSYKRAPYRTKTNESREDAPLPLAA